MAFSNQQSGRVMLYPSVVLISNDGALARDFCIEVVAVFRR